MWLFVILAGHTSARNSPLCSGLVAAVTGCVCLAALADILNQAGVLSSSFLAVFPPFVFISGVWETTPATERSR